ncbi:MAG: hypothetical protein GY841_21870 [FCB group bacterium]|nr:hypothetical protein [FCB group bacterium]
MFKIDKTDYGMKLILAGDIAVEEMTTWLKELKAVIDDMNNDFCAFVDMRKLIPISTEAREPLEAGQKYAKEKGMRRSVVILNNPVLTMQFKGIAHQTGIYVWERYIDASQEPDWERVGLDWLISCVDPDKKVALPQD